MMNKKVFVHFHLYYHDQIDYFIKRLSNIKFCSWDLYVTYIEENKASFDKIKRLKPDTKFIKVENRGYDVWPFIQIVKSINLDNYDYILKIHTKSYRDDTHTSALSTGYKWRNELIDVLIGNKIIFLSNLLKLNNKKVGMICVKKWVRNTLNEESIKDKILIGQETSRINFKTKAGLFCGGTMFLARADIYKFLQNDIIKKEDFSLSKKTDDDATFAHVYERLFGIAVNEFGYKFYTRIYYKGLLEDFVKNIFSVKNEKKFDKTYRIITILGVKLKFKKQIQKNNSTKVSVIMPSYNHQNYVQEAIKSICNQTYQNIELIVIDDGSKDATFEKIMEIKPLCEKRFDRVVFLKQENQGIASTLNNLLSYVKGEYVFLIDSDDVAHPGLIETEAKFLDKNKNYGLIVPDNQIIDSDGKRCFWDENINNVYTEKEAIFKTFVELLKQGHPYFNEKDFGKYWTLYIENYIPNGYMMRKSIIDKFGGYTVDAPLEDYYMMLQLSKYSKFKFIDEVLFSYRWHNTNTVKKRELIEKYTIQTQKYEEKILENLRKNKKLKHIVNSVKYGKLIKRKKVLFVIEKLKYRKNDTEYKVVKCFGIKLYATKVKVNKNSYNLFKRIFKAIKILYFRNINLLKIKQKIKNKEKINIGFVGFSDGSACDVLSSVYYEFIKNSQFKVDVIIVPYSHDTKENMIELQNKAYDYLKSIGIDAKKGYDEENDKYINLSNKYDIVFFDLDYDWVKKEFSPNNFSNSITCFVPYGQFLADNINHHFSQKMMLEFHYIFPTSKAVCKMMKKYSKVFGVNVNNKFLGNPKIQKFFDKNYIVKDIWKKQDAPKKRIIWAPHHLWASYSNFLKYKDVFVELAKKYNDKIQFAFKPHPALYQSLIDIAKFSKEEVDKYYEIWKNMPNSQLETGEWIDLFMTSDAMIMDSIGFMLEYSLTHKPSCVIYRQNNKKEREMKFSECGEQIFDLLYHAKDESEIEDFIENVILKNQDHKYNKRKEYIDENYIPPDQNTAQENIYKFLIRKIGLK